MTRFLPLSLLLCLSACASALPWIPVIVAGMTLTGMIANDAIQVYTLQQHVPGAATQGTGK